MNGFFTQAPLDLSKSGFTVEVDTSGWPAFAAGSDGDVFAGDGGAACGGGCSDACPCCAGCV